MNTTNIATQHKAKIFALIDANGQSVVVRQPQARAASTDAVTKVFGADAYETATGTETTITAWVHQGNVASDFSMRSMEEAGAALGIVAQSDLVLSVKLEDVLLDSSKVYAQTQFDTAKDVVISGSTFKVKGTFRSGLAPIGPYVLWVGLELLD